jgi:hypothetical protein
LSTTDKRAAAPGPYVTRDLCEAIHAEQREANRRTWEELRTLRRLVVMIVLGGQLVAGGLNLAGIAYWLDQHAAHTHPVTAREIETVRTEARADVRDLRHEVRDCLATILRRLESGSARAPENKETQP